MDTKFNGKIWTLGDDIDTDTIIPGKRGTIPTIEEMKRYAFELLKPEFGTAVKPGTSSLRARTLAADLPGNRLRPFFLTMGCAASSQRALPVSSSATPSITASFFCSATGFKRL